MLKTRAMLNFDVLPSWCAGGKICSQGKAQCLNPDLQNYSKF